MPHKTETLTTGPEITSVDGLTSWRRYCSFTH